MSAESFEVSRKHKFPKKIAPSAALQTMPDLRAMSPEYRAVYDIYLRHVKTMLESIGTSKRSKLWKALDRTCNALNIDTSGRANSLGELLSRLRALDMIEGPH